MASIKQNATRRFLQGNRNAEIQERLSRIGTALLAPFDLNTKMPAVMKEASCIFQCESHALSIRDEEGFVVRYFEDIPDMVIGTRMVLEVETHAVLALEKREVQFIEDAWTDERTNNAHVRAWNVRSVIAVPLAAGSKELGVIFFNWHARAVHFDELTRQAAQRLCALLSLALALEDTSAALLRELDRRKAAEEAARQSEEKYGRIVETANEGIAVADTQSRLTFVNKRFAAMLGYERPEELIGRSVFELLPDQELGQKMAARRRSGEQDNYELAYLHKNGSLVWTIAHGTPLRDTEGKVIGSFGMVTDITERKRAEEALHESEKRFRALADNIPQLAWMTDETGWIFWYNQRWYDYTGTTLEEMKGWGWQKVHHPEHMERVTEKFRRAVEAAGNAWEDTFPLRSKEGEYRWFLSRAFPIRDAQGKITHWFGTNTDITEQLEAEEALQSAALFPEENPFPILRIDSAGKLLYANRSSTDILLHFNSQVGSAAPGPFAEAARRTLAQKTLYSFDFTHGLAVYSFVAVPMVDRAYVNLYGRDVAEQRHAEGGLRTLTTELERRVEERTRQLQTANKELESFSYSVSHDLRAPLRLIKGFSEMLARADDGRFSTKDREHIQLIVEQASRMEILIHALLEFSKITRKDLAWAPVETRAMVEEVVQEQRQLMGGDAGGRTTVELGELPTVKADPLLLRQVFVNLLSNAFKFTRTGAAPRITVSSERQDGQITFCVADNGVGFPSGQAEKLFTVFRRLHADSEFEGNGVGLANVRKIIERHGGYVCADGAEGKGASFYFTLPGNP